MERWTAALMAQILDAGGYPIKMCDDNHVGVGVRIALAMIGPIPDQQVIRMAVYIGLEKSMPLAERSALARQMMDVTPLGQFTIDDDGDLESAYEIVVTAGLTPAQFLATVRLFVMSLMLAALGTGVVDHIADDEG